MAQNVPLSTGDPAVQAFFRATQEMLSGASVNVEVTLLNPTTVQIAAGASEAQVSLAIQGKYRYIAAAVQRAHPGGPAGLYDLFATALASDPTTGAPAGLDYSFALAIVPAGSAPSGAAIYRRLRSLLWDGSAITAITRLELERWGGPTDMADLYANRPAASPMLNGLRFVATDKAMTWQCIAGSWILVSVFAPTVGALPPSPLDEQECMLLADATLGVKWHMRYRAASPSTHKWEWVGGDDFYVTDTGHAGAVSGAANTWQNINPGFGVAITFPGDYKVEIAGSLIILSAASCNVSNGVGDLAAPTVALAAAPQSVSQAASGTAQYVLQGVTRVPNVAFAQSLAPLVSFNIPSVTWTIPPGLAMRIRPHRLG